MTQLVEIKLPDIGGNTDVDVIEVAVNVGDEIAIDDTLITLETDKATMDVPADVAGKVAEIKVKVGDKVSEGAVIVLVSTAAAATPVVEKAAEEKVVAVAADTTAPASASAVSLQKILIPDLGGANDVDVIEIAVKVGDSIAIDDTLVTLETDKASMDVPATIAGTVKAVLIKVGDKVSEGDAIVEVETSSSTPVATPKMETPVAQAAVMAAAVVAPSKPVEAFGDTPVGNGHFSIAHAGPAVRKLARELGVNLGLVKGTGRRGRIVSDDVKAFVKQKLSSATSSQASLGGGLDLLPWPKVDFAKFGEIEVKPLSRIKKLSGQNLARNWVMIPHVTQNDEADMTDLEAFRKTLNAEWAKSGLKVSPLVFVIKAVVASLQAFPEFNSSLDGENLVVKKYFNIGFAADTPNGLVVPVLKDADKKGIAEIAKELTELSLKAREGKLKPQEMQGATFTISSLGGIGGTSFTPIINAPEVAILGVCKAQMKPVWNGASFEPRLMCPLSLSYDHRVIDGAAACRFIVYLGKVLADFKRVAL